jgi:hypothetical protein
VGVVERAWLAGGAARASVRFSTRDDVQALWRDVKEGVVRNISMEAAIFEMEETTPKQAKRRSYRATSWEPIALSIVTVPADAGAGFFASDQRTHECVIHGVNMETETDLDQTTDDELEVAKLEKKAAKAEAKRRARIEQLADADRGFGCGDVWAQRMIATDHDDNELCRLASADRVKRDRAQNGNGPSGYGLSLGTEYDSPHAKLSAMTESLAARTRNIEPTGHALRFANATFCDAALECLAFHGRDRGLDVRQHRGEIVRLALHTTSDFPLLLGNVLNKNLLPAYENAQPTFSLIAAKRDFTDFRPQRFLRGGDFPLPLQVGEAGEITHGTMSESEQLVSCLTYARIFGVSRHVLVNDDLGFFSRLAQDAAQRVADLHNSLFFQLCIAPAAGLGPNLSDSVAVYDAAHGNVATSGALDIAKLGAARALMMAQTSLDGLKLNVQPKYLLVSPTSLTLAEQLVSTIAPAQASNANPFAGKLTPIGDANLTGTRFYLLADPSRLPQYIFGNLAGEAPLRVETRVGFEVEGLQVKVATDFGVGCIEHRAGVSGAGA